jgi:signal transduction histidine kinase
MLSGRKTPHHWSPRLALAILYNSFFLILGVVLYLLLGFEIERRVAFLILAIVYVCGVLALELLLLPGFYRPSVRMSAEELEKDRLLSLGLLTAGVAHDLRTPLAVLRGSIESSLEQAREASAREKLHRMLRVTDRLASISTRLLDYSDPRDRPRGPVSIRTVVEEAWNLVSLDPASARVRCENRTSTHDAVAGDEGRLTQVFVNLLGNAARAVQSGGTITVLSRRLVENGQSWVCVAVEDDGPGIPPHVLPNLFKAFVSGRPNGQGTGLGLSVAEGIVFEHGGRLAAENLPRGGARFEIRLPAARMEVIA